MAYDPLMQLLQMFAQRSAAPQQAAPQPAPAPAATQNQHGSFAMLGQPSPPVTMNTIPQIGGRMTAPASNGGFDINALLARMFSQPAQQTGMTSYGKTGGERMFSMPQAQRSRAPAPVDPQPQAKPWVRQTWDQDMTEDDFKAHMEYLKSDNKQPQPANYFNEFGLYGRGGAGAGVGP